MTDLDQTIASLKARVDGLRTRFSDELESLAADFDVARAAFDTLRSEGDDQDQRLRQLEERAEGQRELIDTLRQEAQEAGALRDEVRERDLEIEKIASELQSKKELVQALRRQLAESQHLKATAARQEQALEDQRRELETRQRELEAKAQELEAKQQEIDAANTRAAELGEEVEALRAELENASDSDGAELAALQAELDARRTMIRSLREEAARVETLEEQLDARRRTVAELEDAVERNAQTIEDLRRSAETWKKKYEAQKGEITSGDGTLADAPLFTDTEIDALRELENAGRGERPEAASDAATAESGADDEPEPDIADRTIAIDMRSALSEARSQKSRFGV